MDSLHFTILPSHTSERAEQLLTALRAAVSTVQVTLSLSFSLSLLELRTLLQANPFLSRTGSAGLYGMVARIPDKAVVNDFILEFFNELYSL